MYRQLLNEGKCLLGIHHYRDWKYEVKKHRGIFAENCIQNSECER
jgi:hypothetical protein